MNDLERKILQLPKEAQNEVFDFIEFIIKKYSRKRISLDKEREILLKAAESSLDKFWSNEEDDIYNELYKR